MELRLKNLTKKFGQKTVINHLSVRLTPGVYGLLGANDSGKTTLFKLICGIIKPEEGDVLYNNQSILSNADDFRSVLGFLPQDFTYYSDFTGMKFMLYIAALKGLRGKLAKRRCLELIHLVGLEEVKGQKIKHYSGGMKQRLGIAQALINDPEVLILDEPTVGLDPKERVRFRNLISSLFENKIIILSTHIVSDVEYISDEVIVLKNGVFEDRGSIETLLKSIAHSVWEVTISQKDFKDFSDKYPISNQKYDDEALILRVISEQKPTSNAELVKPNLEDLYLFYFREGASKNDNI